MNIQFVYSLSQPKKCTCMYMWINGESVKVVSRHCPEHGKGAKA